MSTLIIIHPSTLCSYIIALCVNIIYRGALRIVIVESENTRGSALFEQRPWVGMNTITNFRFQNAKLGTDVLNQLIFDDSLGMIRLSQIQFIHPQFVNFNADKPSPQEIIQVSSHTNFNSPVIGILYHPQYVLERLRDHLQLHRNISFVYSLNFSQVIAEFASPTNLFANDKLYVLDFHEAQRSSFHMTSSDKYYLFNTNLSGVLSTTGKLPRNILWVPRLIQSRKEQESPFVTRIVNQTRNFLHMGINGGSNELAQIYSTVDIISCLRYADISLSTLAQLPLAQPRL